ncbi:hypothetical protein [Amycolatopsis nigrescens]|uniref:hypothetical protein n=1 Tax=Amycolatopsis nigrescens TaxID=381445 RepID=UPI00036E93D6|nr:hypothetical protein [Amycolatopsis nigrescens]
MSTGRERLRRLLPALTSLGGVVVFLGCGLLVQVVLASGGNTAVARSPEFVLWSGLVAATAVIYALLYSRSKDLAANWRARTGVPVWQPLVIYVLVASIVVAGLWTANGVAALPPVSVAWVSRALVVCGVAAAAPAVLGLWLAYARLRLISELLNGGAQPPRRADDVLADLLDCRRSLSRGLATLSMIVSTAVVDAGAQRKAFLANGVSEKRFPADAVLMYGALFTAVFLLIYVPTFLAWRKRCLLFTDVVYPLPADARLTEEWAAGRSRLAQLLGTEASVAKNLTTAFGILAPLATSALSIVIPGLK